MVSYDLTYVGSSPDVRATAWVSDQMVKLQVIMPTLHVHDIPDDVYRGLEALALSHSRSIEDEAGEILSLAVKPFRMGQALWELGREIGLTDDEADAIGGRHRHAPTEPIGFER